MTVLLLRLAGPMQAWGLSSRFARRTTQAHPTKSGVLGLLAAAQGRRRTDPIEDLLDLNFGVRIDQPGTLMRDFQTAHQLDSGKAMPLSYRFYLADAVFLAAVEGPQAVIDGLEECLREPVFPLYLGRRSCPPAGPLALGARPESLSRALVCEPWRAASWWQRQTNSPQVHLEVVLDAHVSTVDVEGVLRVGATSTARDLPVSFNPEKRTYAWRSLTQYYVAVNNPAFAGKANSPDLHNPMAALGGN